jgi:hypothetical protein
MRSRATILNWRPMGLTYVDGIVRGGRRRAKRPVRFLVDSGAVYSVLRQSDWRPLRLVARIRAQPSDEKAPADAHVARPPVRVVSPYLSLPKQRSAPAIIFTDDNKALQLPAVEPWIASRALRSLLLAVLALFHATGEASGQLLTVGAGALISNRPAEVVFEVHVASPPAYRARAYATLSWTDDSAKPTLISAAERTMIASRAGNVGLGAGLLWLDANEYRPYPIVVSSAVVPLPIRRTSAVVIAATQPFQEWDWSLVLKVGVLAWFRK